MTTSQCKTSFRPVLKAIDRESGTIYLYQPDCHMWSCDHCAHQNKRTWSARIGQGIEKYQRQGLDDWRFITITMSRKLKTRAQCLYTWPKCWSKLSARLRRKYKGVRYVLLPELHKDGRVHVHAIMSHGVGERWLKDNSAYSGLGFMAESDPMKRDNIYFSIWYVTKYIGKGLGVPDWPRNYRRIRTSQMWPEFDEEENEQKLDLEWQYWRTCTPEQLKDFARQCSLATKMDVKLL